MSPQVNVPILGVIENMSFLQDQKTEEKRYLFGQGGGPLTAKNLETVFLGEVPLDEEIRLGGDHGIPIILGHPDSAASAAFSEIAGELNSLLPAGD